MLKKLTKNPAVVSAVVAGLIRGISSTLRIELKDEAGIFERPTHEPVIWAFWHNRIFVMPYIYGKYLSQRKGAVLTSASGDGGMIAAVMERFGVKAIRGSSSRRGRAALIECIRLVREGGDLVVTPDGPRGPKYVMQPGMIKVASTTRVPVMPVRVDYARAKALGTWDGFRIPYPFSKVTVTFGVLEQVPHDLPDDEALLKERDRVAAKMGQDCSGTL